MEGEEGKHTGVPISHSNARRAMSLVLDVETPTSRTQKRTSPAVDTRKLHVFPETSFVEIKNINL
jgi:hypothetical protein